MIVKPSISFLNTDPDPRLITSITNIITALTRNASYTTPSPTLAVMSTSLNVFIASVAAAAGGGVALTSAKNDKRAKLVALVRQLAGYVQIACLGSYTTLLTSGFPTQKPERQPVGTLPAPANLTVRLGPLSGSAISKADPVAGALIYNWRLSLASSPHTPLKTVQTGSASNTFEGLTPATAYIIDVNAVGSSGPSNWSEPVTQIVV